MENSNLLDDRVGEEGLPLRTAKLIRVEKACLIGCTFFFSLYIWNLMSSSSFDYGYWGLSLLSDIAIFAYVALFGGLFGWQKWSKQYDLSRQQPTLPKVLGILRVFMFLFIVSTFFNIGSSFFSTILGSNLFDNPSTSLWVWLIALQILGIGLTILLAYYLYITSTEKIEKHGK